MNHGAHDVAMTRPRSFITLKPQSLERLRCRGPQRENHLRADPSTSASSQPRTRSLRHRSVSNEFALARGLGTHLKCFTAW